MDIIDTRTLLDELRAYCGGDEENPDKEVMYELNEDELTRFEQLDDLRAEIGPEAFQDGTGLIPESDFEDYARQYAEDCGAIEEDGRWPTYCIDWARAADDLKMDYSSVDFDGITYLYRAS